MPMFRKKPVVIEARHFDGTHYSADHLIEWMGNVGRYILKDNLSGQLYVGTLEDGDLGEAKHVASKGDWIIKGVAGEFYPCKPEIFEASYEITTDSLPTRCRFRLEAEGKPYPRGGCEACGRTITTGLPKDRCIYTPAF